MTVPAPLEPSLDTDPSNSASSGIERSSRLQAPDTEHGPSDHNSERDIMSDPRLSDKTRLEQVIVHGNDAVERSAANGHDIIEEVNLESGGDEALHSLRSATHVDANLGVDVPPEHKPDNVAMRSSFRAGSIAGAAAACSNSEGVSPIATPAQPHSTSAPPPSRTAPSSGNAGPNRQSKEPFLGLHQNTGNHGTSLCEHLSENYTCGHLCCAQEMITRQSTSQIHGVRKSAPMLVSGEYISTRQKLTTPK